MNIDERIGGIFLTVETGSNWQTINNRVYHRDKGKGSWGYFAINEKATAESYKMQDDHSVTLFDGQHLRIHFTESTEIQPFDLDITFSSTSHGWSGTWSHSHQTFQVLLKRPEPNTGVIPSVFVGDWMDESTKPYLASGSLQIRQSSDGILSAWLDRSISSEQRNGERLLVHSAAASEFLLERPGDIGPSSHYNGRLSEDGQVLTGDWTQNSGQLNAPDRFRKLPN